MKTSAENFNHFHCISFTLEISRLCIYQQIKTLKVDKIKLNLAFFNSKINWLWNIYIHFSTAVMACIMRLGVIFELGRKLLIRGLGANKMPFRCRLPFSGSHSGRQFPFSILKFTISAGYFDLFNSFDSWCATCLAFSDTLTVTHFLTIKRAHSQKSGVNDFKSVH